MKDIFKLLTFAFCVILTFIAAAGQAALDMDRFDEFVGTFTAVGGDVEKHVDAAQPRGSFEPIPLIESRTVQTGTTGVANPIPSNPRDPSPLHDGKAVPVNLSADGPRIRPADAVYTAAEESEFGGFFSSDDDYFYADGNPYKPYGQGPGGGTGSGKIVDSADPPAGDPGPTTAGAPAAQVPEPGTMLLLGIAMAAMAVMRKKLTR